MNKIHGNRSDDLAKQVNAFSGLIIAVSRSGFSTLGALLLAGVIYFILSGISKR